MSNIAMQMSVVENVAHFTADFDPSLSQNFNRVYDEIFEMVRDIGKRYLKGLPGYDSLTQVEFGVVYSNTAPDDNVSYNHLWMGRMWLNPRDPRQWSMHLENRSATIVVSENTIVMEVEGQRPYSGRFVRVLSTNGAPEGGMAHYWDTVAETKRTHRAVYALPVDPVVAVGQLMKLFGDRLWDDSRGNRHPYPAVASIHPMLQGLRDLITRRFTQQENVSYADHEATVSALFAFQKLRDLAMRPSDGLEIGEPKDDYDLEFVTALATLLRATTVPLEHFQRFINRIMIETGKADIYRSMLLKHLTDDEPVAE